ncbi:hypothetical protein [Kribbella sp. CA-293567]|uniref:hypothetical protein n=1 Tax=Kribbella sp. CA-293567 TaxID=3002436 RepID=UPI0022DDFFD7|nr:hypothetical protein [Kribbella sp. CA-293567]WBQ05492.1 hypothetical protein OX958_01535 [Kribbella sp. CA-293567]
MESLDDVIDAMIADRVIHRHRRKWLIAVGVVLVLALVILLTGGWKERKGRTVDTMDAPATLKAGRFEVGVSGAKLIQTPKTDYSPAKARLEVALQLKNIDEEEHKSVSFDTDLLRWVVPGKDPVKPENVSCKDRVVGYVLVYGLPAENCVAKFDVSPNYKADSIEVGVLAESYTSANGLLGATEDPYWQGENAVAVVRMKTETTTETEG